MIKKKYNKKLHVHFHSGLGKMIENVLSLTQYEIYTSFFENTLFSWVTPLGRE